MSKLIFVILLAVLLPFAAAAQSKERRGQGYVFVAPTSTTEGGFGLHIGGGGEGLVYKGLGVGGEIGYVLARRYWGQGYATEAAAAVLQFGFVRLGLRAIEAQALPENVASLRVMAKLGLRYRETRMVSDATTGTLRPVCVWQIGREQWAGGSDGA